MKARPPFLIVAGLLITSAGSAYLYNGIAHGEWDPTQLEQQVQHNTEQLQNHEIRITNSENDIKELQSSTGTAPSSNNTTPSEVTTQPVQNATQATTQTPTPSYVTIWHRNYDACGLFLNYRLTWSDGSTTYSDTQPTTGTAGNPVGGYGEACSTN